MNNEIIFGLILVNILIGLPLLILFLFYKKINIRDSYKKIIIFFLALCYWLLTLFILVSNNVLKNNKNIIDELFPNGNYENLILLLPVIILLLFIVFYILRISLGRIDIKIFGDYFTSGDNLAGEIILKIRKEIKNADFCIYLRGYQRVRNSGANSGHHWEKRYEDKIILEENMSFGKGFIKTYNFSFNIPYLKKVNQEDGLNNLEKKLKNDALTDEQIEMALKFSKGVLNFIGKDTMEKEFLKLWKIEVVLEKEGINMFNQKYVNIIRKVE